MDVQVGETLRMMGVGLWTYKMKGCIEFSISWFHGTMEHKQTKGIKKHECHAKVLCQEKRKSRTDLQREADKKPWGEEIREQPWLLGSSDSSPSP